MNSTGSNLKGLWKITLQQQMSNEKVASDPTRLCNLLFPRYMYLSSAYTFTFKGKGRCDEALSEW